MAGPMQKAEASSGIIANTKQRFYGSPRDSLSLWWCQPRWRWRLEARTNRLKLAAFLNAIICALSRN